MAKNNPKWVQERSEKYQRMYDTYRTLAKRADNRLKNLEKLAEKNSDYSNIKKYAYARASRDLNTKEGEKPRFDRGISKNTNQLERQIAKVVRFLNSETSTKKGVDQAYKNKADAFNKSKTKDGKDSNMTWQDQKTIFDRGIWDKLEQKYGSLQAQKLIQNMSNAITDNSIDALIKKLDGKELTKKENKSIEKYIENNDELNSEMAEILEMYLEEKLL